MQVERASCCLRVAAAIERAFYFSGSRHICEARIGTADGYHLAIAASFARGSLCGIRCCRRLEFLLMDGS